MGAVVLTLKATGCGLLFVIVSERLTSVVSGPKTTGELDSKQGPHRRTFKAEGITGAEGDRHGGAGGGGGNG